LQDLYKNSVKITDYLCQECDKEWKELKENLENLSVSFSHEPNLVRGLDYYQKTVFEFVSTDLGAQSSFCAGGRYDKLVKEISGKEDQKSVGAAIGVERILIILEKIKDKLDIPKKSEFYAILPLSREEQDIALLICDEIQAKLKKDFSIDIFLEEDSLKSMLRKADKLEAKFAIIIGSEEKIEKKVTVKNMITGKEEKISQKDLVKYLT